MSIVIPTRASSQRSSRDSLYAMLEEHARLTPTALAIAATNQQEISYGELLKQVTAIIDRLSALGLSGNDRVAVVLPNGPELAICFAEFWVRAYGPSKTIVR